MPYCKLLLSLEATENFSMAQQQSQSTRTSSSGPSVTGLFLGLASLSAGAYHGYHDAQGIPLEPENLEAMLTYGPMAVRATLGGIGGLLVGGIAGTAIGAGTRGSLGSAAVGGAVGSVGGSLLGAAGGAIGGGIQTLVGYGVGYVTGMIAR